MGEVVQFIPKRDLDRARLIQEARAIYEGIFPTEKGPASLQRGPNSTQTMLTSNPHSVTYFSRD